MKSKLSVRLRYRYFCTLFLLLPLWAYGLYPAGIQVGTATVDITPPLPVAMDGQRHLRIAELAETPLTASIIALESVDDGITLDMAIMVSSDLVVIPDEVLEKVRSSVGDQLPEIDVIKIFLNVTHTHTGPVLREAKEYCDRARAKIAADPALEDKLNRVIRCSIPRSTCFGSGMRRSAPTCLNSSPITGYGSGHTAGLNRHSSSSLQAGAPTFRHRKRCGHLYH